MAIHGVLGLKATISASAPMKRPSTQSLPVKRRRADTATNATTSASCSEFTLPERTSCANGFDVSSTSSATHTDGHAATPHRRASAKTAAPAAA